MAIKAGQVLHDAYGFVIDRIQTGGASGLNIPEEQIYEVGNFRTVAIVRDIPDLTFGMESFDVSTEVESLLTFTDPTTVNTGDSFMLDNAIPMDVISPLKDAWNVFTTSHGIAIPYLTLESAAYRFDIRNNATQNFTLRGDSYFFTDGTPYYEEFDGDGATATFTLGHPPALPYSYHGITSHVLSLSVVYANRTYRRLFAGPDSDYVDDTTTFTLNDPTIAPAGSTIRAVYGSSTIASYTQTDNTPLGNPVHEGVSVKPAAVKGKSIDVYIGTADATPTWSRLTSVQSAEINWSVTLDRDEEFGNAQVVNQDHDVPTVNGNVVLRPRDVAELYTRVHEVTNTTTGNVASPLTSLYLPLEVRVSDPDTGTRLKTFYIPDARFRLPNIEARVQTKQNVTFNWSSDGGALYIYDGAR